MKVLKADDNPFKNKSYTIVDKFKWYPNENFNEYINRITGINFLSKHDHLIILKNELKQSKMKL